MTGHPPPADLRALVARPERFDFFAAIRLVEAAFPEQARLGEGRRAVDEPMRLGQPPHLAFPPGDVAAYEPGGAGPARLRAYVLGLFGPHGPLPLHVTAHARERARREQDTTFADFCDLFHHRLLSFFYRAWANARPTVQQDRPDRDRFALKVGALAGLATPAFARRHALPDRFALFGAGLLTQRGVRLRRLPGSFPAFLELQRASRSSLASGWKCRDRIGRGSGWPGSGLTPFWARTGSSAAIASAWCSVR